jgi:hypothetical protein
MILSFMYATINVAHTTLLEQQAVSGVLLLRYIKSARGDQNLPRNTGDKSKN